MQFLIIGKDGEDAQAEKRRMTAREQHLQLGDAMEASGGKLLKSTNAM
ncbi:MAG: hypothetical protein WCJ58_08250 [bacterium]